MSEGLGQLEGKFMATEVAPALPPSNSSFEMWGGDGVNADLTITGRRVIGCLMEKGTNGARASDIASELGMNTNHVKHVLGRQLEPIGEVFKAGERWVATDAALNLKYDSRAVVERLKAELESTLFDGGKPPERIVAFLEEYRAARDLPSPLSQEEAFKFAQRRALRAGVE